MKKVLVWQVNVRLDDMIKKYFIEAKTERGAIGNLKNILYAEEIKVLKAFPVMD